MIVDKCVLCHSEDIRMYGEYPSVPRISVTLPFGNFEANLIVKYSICNRCGMIWQNPRMSDEELDTYYSKGYYRQSLGISEEVMDKDEMERALRIASELKGDFMSHLDIGSSRGYLLTSVRNSFGVGISEGVESNVGYDKSGFEIVKSFDEVDTGRGKFDLITMIHVLEHTTDPVMELVKVSELLSDTGTLVIEVPSFRSKGGPFRLAHTLHMEQPVLYHICKSAGLKVFNSIHGEHTQVWARHA